MGDKEEQAFNSLIGALNDLDKGQKEVLNAINMLPDKPGRIKTTNKSILVIGFLRVVVGVMHIPPCSVILIYIPSHPGPPCHNFLKTPTQDI